MRNIRIRSAVLAFFLGNLGVDMLLLRPHQVKLFLSLGGAFIAVAVVFGILAVTQNGAWLILTVIAGAFLEFWSFARCLEYLNLTDAQFERLLAESNPLPGQHTAMQPTA